MKRVGQFFCEKVLQLVVGFGLALLPLQQLWLRIIEDNIDQPFLITALTSWLGPVVAVAGGVALVVLPRRKLAAVDIVFLLFLGYVALQALWHPDLSGSYLYGLRYGVLAMLFYLVGRIYLAGRDWDALLRVVLRAVIVVAGFQLLLWSFNLDPIASALRLQELFYAGPAARLYGSLAGPNQLATFVVISSLWLYWRKKIGLAEFCVAGLVVVGTFSRSAMLALLVGWTVPTLLRWGRLTSLKWLPIVAAVVSVGVVLIFNVHALRSVLVESRNYEQRIAILTDTWSQLTEFAPTELIFGLGAGSSGPANLITGKGLIPENWYLQTIYEYGLLGLTLLLGFLFQAIRVSWRAGMPAVAAIVLAVMTNSLFLHPLSDNFAAAAWLFMLIGWSVTRTGSEANG